MHVDAQDLAEQRIDVLTAAKWIASAAAVTQRGIEISVGSKTDPAPCREFPPSLPTTRLAVGIGKPFCQDWHR